MTKYLEDKVPRGQSTQRTKFLEDIIPRGQKSTWSAKCLKDKVAEERACIATEFWTKIITLCHILTQEITGNKTHY